MSELMTDIDQTIAHAVNARIEAEVLKALSGDEVIGRFVTAALQQNVTVKSGYRDEKVPFLRHILSQAIQEATQTAVRRLLLEEMPKIEDEIRLELKRQSAAMAKGLVKSLADAADKAYGIKVELNMPRSDG